MCNFHIQRLMEGSDNSSELVLARTFPERHPQTEKADILVTFSFELGLRDDRS